MSEHDSGALDDFTPVPTRARRDGWTPERQEAFLQALAECACVDEACQRVGMGRSAAYALRRRPDAQSFRLAWDSALDYAVRQLADRALSRALNGVARPVFYKGEQIGERRYYDERLAMFILRYRDPVTYGKANDRCEFNQVTDGPALVLNRRINQAADDAWEQALFGVPKRKKFGDSTGT